jgi:hypothetical protein
VILFFRFGFLFSDLRWGASEIFVGYPASPSFAFARRQILMSIGSLLRLILGRLIFIVFKFDWVV